MEILWVIVLLIIAGVVPGIVARGMGRSFLSWWVYGTFLLPIALVHVGYLRWNEGMKMCPYCHTKNRINAKHCARCGYEFIEF